MMVAERRLLHYGSAAPTRLVSVMGVDSMSFEIENDKGWPKDHSINGDFVVTIDRGTTREERILCHRQNGRHITVAINGRGWDMTAPVEHDINATVEHTFSAFEADELDIHLKSGSNVHGVNGPLVGMDDVADMLTLLDLIPAGLIAPYGGPNAPTGWLLCDGAEYLTDHYPGLFAAIGHLHTPLPHKQSHFRVPDLRDRTIVGTPQGGPIGQANGSYLSQVTLTDANLPVHAHTTPALGHTVTDPGHGHTTAGHSHGFTTLGAGAHDHAGNNGLHSHAVDTREHQGGTSNPMFTAAGSTQSGFGLGLPNPGDHVHGGSTDWQAPAANGNTTGITVTDHPAGVTGPTGNQQPFNVSTMQPSRYLNYIIKAGAGEAP